MITVLSPFAGRHLRPAHDFTASTAGRRVAAADRQARLSLEWYDACRALVGSTPRWRGWVEQSKRESDDASAYAAALHALIGEPLPTEAATPKPEPRPAMPAQQRATTSVLVGHALSCSADASLLGVPVIVIARDGYRDEDLSRDAATTLGRAVTVVETPPLGRMGGRPAVREVVTAGELRRLLASRWAEHAMFATSSRGTEAP
jgi:hypothetical protein